MKRTLFIIGVLISIFSSLNAQVKVLSNGNFGIGTTSPVEKLDVKGNAVFLNGSSVYPRIHIEDVDAEGAILPSQSYRGYVGYNSKPFSRVCANIMYRNGAYSLSDKRVKKNIKRLTNNLDKVMKLNPVEYD